MKKDIITWSIMFLMFVYIVYLHTEINSIKDEIDWMWDGIYGAFEIVDENIDILWKAVFGQ